jgi:hypothetical protein
MKSPLSWVLVLAVVAGLFATAALTMRYEFLPVSGAPGLLRHDRFTGEVVYCRPTKWPDKRVTVECPQVKEALLDFSNQAEPVKSPDPWAKFEPVKPSTFQQRPIPPNGQAWLCTTGPCRPLNQQSTTQAPFEIKSTTGQDYLVKLARSSVEYILIFVRGGSLLTIDVPLGTYTVTYATGSTWHGYRDDKKFFGPETIYSKASEAFEFSVDGNRVSGVSVTLYRVARGNLRIRSISAAEF